MYESLSGKPFGELNGKDEEDVLRLMYCSYINTNSKEGKRHTYSVWSKVIKENYAAEVAKFARNVSNDIRFVNQFKGLPALYEEEKKPQAKKAVEQEKDFLTDVITSAMMTGVDTPWLLQQGIEILPTLRRAESLKYQERMDEGRFWAFVLLSPYRDSKNQKTIDKWLPMPWDKKNRERMNAVTEDELNFAHAMLDKKNNRL